MELTLKNQKIYKLENQTKEISKAIEILFNVKREIILKVEDTKQKIKRLFSKKNVNKKPSIIVRDKTVSLLDRDISHIQNLHDIVVQDLEDLKNSLNTHASIIEKTELIMNILNYKVYEIQHAFKTESNKLKEKKENLLKLSTENTDVEDEDPTTALAIVELNDEITKLEDSHQNNLDCIKEQKLDSQKAYERAVAVMDENFDKMTKGLNKLLILIEAEKSNLNESQAQLVDSKFAHEIENISVEIERFTALQTTGWKITYPDEKLAEFLNERGLKILNTGQLITEDGQTITFKHAEESKLFGNVPPDMLKEIKANIIASDTTDESSIHTSTTFSSIGSKMSSDDVNYLKECLGKPLALGLAEITSVQPRDPIHYLGHWLFKYRYNQQMDDINSVEMDALNEKRNKIAQERWHKFIEDEAKAAVIDMIIRAEEIAFMNELRRIQFESDQLEEMEGLDDEARDVLGIYNGPSTGQPL